MVERPITLYEDLMLRLAPHYNQIQIKHKIPMSELQTIFKQFNEVSQKKLLARKLKFKNQLNLELDEISRKTTEDELKRIDYQLKDKWEITSRSIKAHGYLNIKHSMGMHQCSRIEITPTIFKIDSSYNPTKLISLLRRIFKNCTNIKDIAFKNYMWIEIKTAIPIEFSDIMELKRLFPGRHLLENRPNIRTHYYAEMEPGLTVKNYSIKGYKPFTFNLNGLNRIGFKNRDKTKQLLVKPLEFCFNFKEPKFRKKIINKANYDHNVKALKEYLLYNILLGSNKQAKIPFLYIPELWRNSYQIKGNNTYNISSEASVYTIGFEKTESTNKNYVPRLKNPVKSVWSDKDYRYNLSRITYVHNLLEYPCFKDHKKRWEKRYRFIFHSDIDISIKQLTVALRAVQVPSINQKVINSKFIELYAYCRTYYKKRYRKNVLNRKISDFLRFNCCTDNFKKINNILDNNTQINSSNKLSLNYL